MATKPAGGTAYGDISNLRQYFADDLPCYRGGETVATPLASYTVDELLALINAAVAAATVTTATSTGYASRVEA